MTVNITGLMSLNNDTAFVVLVAAYLTPALIGYRLVAAADTETSSFFPLPGLLCLETLGFLPFGRLAPAPFILGPLGPVEIPAGFAVGLSRDARLRAPGAEACCYPHIAAFPLVVAVVFPAFRVLAALVFVFAWVCSFGLVPL